MLAVPLAASELSASRAGDKLVTLVRPSMTRPSLRRTRADLTKFEAIAAAFARVGVARLAAVTGKTPRVFLAGLSHRTPAVTDGFRRLPSILLLAEKIVTNLEPRGGQFASAASLPGFGLTLHESVAVELGIGALLVLVGFGGLARPHARLVPALFIVGLLLVVTPLALDYPRKTADTDALLGSLRPFSVQKVRDREAGLATVRALFAELRGDVLPQAAAAAHKSPAAVAADLGAASPQLTPASLHRIDLILTRFGAGVALSARIQPLLVKADGLSAEAAMWLLLAPGAALMLAVAIAVARRRFPQPPGSDP